MTSKYPQVLLEDHKPDRITTLEEYRQSSGYQGLKAALQPHQQAGIMQVLEDARLAGPRRCRLSGAPKAENQWPKTRRFRGTSCAMPMKWSPAHLKIGC